MNDDKNSNIIVISDLSDSGESCAIVESLEFKKRTIRETDALSDSSFEFPEVNFHYENINKEPKRQREESSLDSDSDSCKSFNLKLNSGLSSGSSGYHSKNSQESAADILLQKYSILKKADSFKKTRRKKSPTKKTEDKQVDKRHEDKEAKERLKAEKQKKKEEQAREKALKAVATKNLKNLKPQECIKSIKVIIDLGIQRCQNFTTILSSLQEHELTFDIESQLIPHSICWKRKIEENYVNEKGEICTRKYLQDENQVIIVWSWDEVVEKIANSTFSESINNISNILPQKRITLFVYGIIDYFSYHKNLKDKIARDEVLTELGNEKPKKRYNKNDKVYGTFPKISRNDFEVNLTEIQVLNNISSKVIQSPQELALAIYQFTKAIAESPFKKEKNKNMEDKVSWYAAGDNRDTVKVDKDGVGLKRLWQQQLCQFNLSSLEIAEAVCKVYGSPLQLLDAYTKCSQIDGEMLLKDVPIRRAAGPVTSLRKIGPELSKKIYTMFTSENGEILLNND